MEKVAIWEDINKPWFRPGAATDHACLTFLFKVTKRSALGHFYNNKYHRSLLPARRLANARKSAFERALPTLAAGAGRDKYKWRR